MFIRQVPPGRAGIYLQCTLTSVLSGNRLRSRARSHGSFSIQSDVWWYGRPGQLLCVLTRAAAASFVLNEHGLRTVGHATLVLASSPVAGRGLHR